MSVDLADYLSSRRSALSMTLTDPGPVASEIEAMIGIASRVPDHGKLAPWRFEHWTMPFRQALHSRLIAELDRQPSSPEREKDRKGTDKLLHGPCLIAVISTARDHPKIPQWEQVLSTGAACQNLLMAANAHGFEAQWLTAWYVYGDGASERLGLGQDERIAGLIHIGTERAAPPERPRPDMARAVTWMAE